MHSRRFERRVALLAGLVLTSGCQNKCENAYERTVGLFQEDHSIPAGPKEAVLTAMKTDAAREKALEECKTRKPEELECVLKAADYGAVLACTGGAPPQTRAGQTGGTGP